MAPAAADSWLDDLEEAEAEAEAPPGRGLLALGAQPGGSWPAEAAARASPLRSRSLSPTLERERTFQRLGAMLPQEQLEMRLETRQRTADGWFQARQRPGKDLSHLREKVDKLFAGPQSFSHRTVLCLSEDSASTLRLSAAVSTTVREIKELVSGMTGVRPVDIRVLCKKGSYWRQEGDFDEISSKVRLLGVPAFGRQKHRYEHPVAIVGAGFGGVSSAIELLREGYDNFLVFERHADFGGHSWVGVANKCTKLQTEKGTYHVNYPYADFPCPDYMPVWPSRDQLLEMFRRESRGYGLEEKTLFGTEVCGSQLRGAQDSPARSYCVRHRGVEGYLAREPGPERELTAGAVVAWPGNLCFSTKLELPCEEEFGGYIEYGSEDRADYRRVRDCAVVLYGHGAFMIENVRTLMEHAARKVWVVCRKRNLTAPKMVSWLMSQTAAAATGVMLLKAYEPMYRLAGFDPWTAHSVITDKNHSVARITQKTVFGVTDVYFLALYYGRAEVVIDEIKRLSHHAAHLKKGRTLSCEVILKVVGISADPRTDEIFGVTELVGFWIEGDALRPCCCNGLGVNAQNFVSFSVGPAICGNCTTVHHFLVYPGDLDLVREGLPRHRASEASPAYVPEGAHWLQSAVVLNSSLPGLAIKMAHFDGMKSRKQHIAHPLQQYIQECRMEWEMYIEMFGTDEKPAPPYPYTEEMMMGFIEEIYEEARQKWAAKG